jgi:hypothetical protein
VIRARRVLPLVALFGLAPVASACQALFPSAADRVTIQNDTTTIVTVLVNGGLADRIEAGAIGVIQLQGRGGPPFRIEARSPGGNVLFEWTISEAEYGEVRDGNTTMSTGTAPGCGWIEARFGGADLEGPIAEAPVGRAAPGGVCP